MATTISSVPFKDTAENAAKLKEMGAGRIFIFSTFGLFVDGLDKFDDYYKNGLIDKIFTTNLWQIKILIIR